MILHNESVILNIVNKYSTLDPGVDKVAQCYMFFLSAGSLSFLLNGAVCLSFPARCQSPSPALGVWLGGIWQF